MDTVAAYRAVHVQAAVDRGGQAVLDLTPDAREWADAALDAIRDLAAAGEFTSDDLHWRVPPPPSPNAVGAIIRRAARSGLIVQCGWRESRRITARGRAVRVWVGV